jgi:hypothetical protein
LAALAIAGPAPLAGAATGQGDGPLEEAGKAAEHVPFSALVSVAWADQRGFHVTRMDVSAAGGRVRVHGPAATVPGGHARQLLADHGWLLSWQDGAGPELTPAIERKYQVARGPGPLVADRATSLVLLRAGGELRERLAVDEATGLVLRREVLGADGHPLRVVTVERLKTGAAAGSQLRAAAHERLHPVRMAALPAPYRAPRVLAEGYERVGAYERSGVVHVLYSDGLHGLSLFLRPGALAHRSLPAGGQPMRVGPAAGVRYAWAGGEVVTWQAGPVVHTVVGEASLAEVLAAARSVPTPRSLGLLARLSRSCRRVAEVISGGR